MNVKEIKFFDSKQNQHLSDQSLIVDVEEHNDAEVTGEVVDKEYEKELINSLIESEKDKIHFQNTKNNVAITNTRQASSKMCLLM